MRTAWRRFRHSERGQAMVETALVLPIFALLLLAMVDGGRVFSDWIVVTNGAREGARIAAVGGTEAQIDARVQTAMADVTPYTITTSNVGGPSGQSVSVEVSHGVTLVTPLIGAILGSVFTVHSTAVMRLE